MRILKGVLLFLLGALILLAVVSLFLSDTVRVERTVLINAPVEKVFAEVNSLKKFSKWSPWANIDPAMEQSFSGPDEGVGAKVAWSSKHQQVGSGTQEIIESRSNKFVKTQLTFGWGNPAQADFTLLPEGSATRLTWGLFSHLPNPVEKYFGLMMDDWVGSAYEQGLADLKVRLEAQ